MDEPTPITPEELEQRVKDAYNDGKMSGLLLAFRILAQTKGGGPNV
jgi:hypothetical protein